MFRRSLALALRAFVLRWLVLFTVACWITQRRQTVGILPEIIVDRLRGLGLVWKYQPETGITLMPVSYTHLDVYKRQELKKRGFNFVGSTICYAFIQAVGMVNDHVVQCFRHGEVI